MAIIQSIILGVIQGATEFLPISSSAHLVLVPWVFGWNYNGLGFDTALHFGTAIAIVVFFWRDWVSIIARAISHKKQDTRNNNQTNSKSEIRNPKSNEAMKQYNNYPQNLLWQILIASIPAAIVGYLLSDYVETYLHSPILLAINLAVFGIILWLVDIYSNYKQKGTQRPWNCSAESRQKKDKSEFVYSRDSYIRSRNNNITMSESASGNNETMNQDLPLNKINYKQSLIVGLSQTLALVPGISRSGITMTAGRSLGMSRESSARFSFILSAPVLIGAFLFEARKVDWTATSFPFWLTIIITAIVGLLTIKYLLKYLQRGSFLVFTVYRVILAIIIIVLFLMR